MQKLKNIIKESYAGIFISLCLSYVLLFYEPINIYANNIDDFWFDIYRFFPIVLSQFLIVFIILSIIFIVIRLINKKVYSFFVVVTLIGTICTYIQGNYMVSSLPAVTGTWIDFDEFKTEKMLSIILWVVVTAVIVFLLWKYKFKGIETVAKYSSIVIILMVSSSYISIFTEPGFFDKKNYIIATYDNFSTMSSNKNFVIFVVDSIDSEDFNERLELTKEKEAIFKDFTYFPDTLGGYPFTRNSIPLILSGKWYENEKPYKDYLTETLDSSVLFGNLENDGYELNLYESDLNQYNGTNFKRYKNLTQGAPVDLLKLYENEARLILYKYLPYQLKWRAQAQKTYIRGTVKNDDDNYVEFENSTPYQKIKNEDIEVVDQNNFKFIHIQGGHVPFIYDKDVNIIEKGSYSSGIDATITIIKTYLEKLKENNLFDNTTIVIMSDHGYGYGALNRGNPLLFIKGFNEHHDYTVSDKKVSYINLVDAFNMLLEGKKSTDLFDVDNTERRYLYYALKTPEVIKEYKFTGNAWNHDGFTPTGKEYILK